MHPSHWRGTPTAMAISSRVLRSRTPFSPALLSSLYPRTIAGLVRAIPAPPAVTADWYAFQSSIMSCASVSFCPEAVEDRFMVVRFENVGFVRGERHTVLAGLDLAVESGEIVGIVG